MSKLFNLNMLEVERVRLGQWFLQRGGTQFKTKNVVIGYILEGSVRYIYDGRTFDGGPGDLIYGPDASSYYSIWQGEPYARFYTISFSFVDKTDFGEYGLNIIKNYPRESFDEIFANYPHNMLKCISLLYEILADLYGGRLVVKKNVSKSLFVAKASDYINKNATDKITVAELAKHCGVSESYLFSAFKKELGCSPVKYKHNTLVNLAIYKLLYTEESVESICDSLGFSSLNYFRRVFKNVTGKSPTAFKKTLIP